MGDEINAWFGDEATGQGTNEDPDHWWTQDEDEVQVKCWPDRVELRLGGHDEPPWHVAVRADRSVAVKQGRQHAKLANSGTHAGRVWVLQANSATAVWRQTGGDEDMGLALGGKIMCGSTPASGSESG